MIKNILFSLVVALILILGGAATTNAQATYGFPYGCSSAIGYSATTGATCNGQREAFGPVRGCTTALGYSAYDGTPCSGSNYALQYLAGCTSLIGYSAADGHPCNGTNVASQVLGSNTVVPGFPYTGLGGDKTTNILLLVGTALAAVLGLAYVLPKNRFTK